MDIRNIAITAHLDDGTTPLIDSPPRQPGVGGNRASATRAPDTNGFGRGLAVPGRL